MDQVMEMGIPISATMVYGHVETLEERAEHLLKLLDLQRRRGLIMAFTAWNFEPENTELASEVPYQWGGNGAAENCRDRQIGVQGRIEMDTGRLVNGGHEARPSLPGLRSQRLGGERFTRRG